MRVGVRVTFLFFQAKFVLAACFKFNAHTLINVILNPLRNPGAQLHHYACYAYTHSSTPWYYVVHCILKSVS